MTDAPVPLADLEAFKLKMAGYSKPLVAIGAALHEFKTGKLLPEQCDDILPDADKPGEQS